MTLIPARSRRNGKNIKLKLGDGAEVETIVPRGSLQEQGELRLGLRPESVRVETGDRVTTRAKVELVERLGERTLIYARFANGQTITAEDEGNSRVKIGDDVGIRIDGSAAHIFGADGASHHARAQSL